MVDTDAEALAGAEGLLGLDGPVGEMTRALYGCDWGTLVSTEDDEADCRKRAVQITVIHDGEKQKRVKLCPAHNKRLQEETDPRSEDS